MINLSSKYTAIAVVIVLVAAYMGNEYVKRKILEKAIITAPVLKENEAQKIIVDTNKREVRVVKRGPMGKGKGTKEGNTEVVKVTEGARTVVITELNDGTIQVVALNKGFCFEPGLALYYSEQARLGVDVQFAYWKQWGVLLGAGVNTGDRHRTVRAYVAVNHAVPLNFLDNTTVFIGVDTKKDAVLGLRIRF